MTNQNRNRPSYRRRYSLTIVLILFVLYLLIDGARRAIRAFDLKTGMLLWWPPLPAGGHAGPSTYISPKSGRQFVVISVGGSAQLHLGAGDLVAYSLPKQ
jgi:glucose dehydrogenase